MNKFKFTGTNIAAALLVLAYFFPWVSVMTMTMSGFSVTSNGVSPGILAGVITGLTRLFMVLAFLVPLCGATILYQNITGNRKFEKFYKPAHIIPAIFLISGIAGLYFKMKPDAPAYRNDMFGEMTRRVSDMTPGAFDIMSFGVYLSLAAAIYLLLVSFGKIKDKEYYKPAPANTENPEIPKNQ